MTKVEELRHHLVIELADEGARPHPEGWHEDLADAEQEVDALISATRDEERIGKLELHLAFPNLPTWTWVEKLRETILAGHETTESVDNLISAAIAYGRSEGVAEGAERAKASIWKAQLYGYRVQLYPFPHDEREGLRVEIEVAGKQYVMVPVVSVLAPTKESEK